VYYRGHYITPLWKIFERVKGDSTSTNTFTKYLFSEEYYLLVYDAVHTSKGAFRLFADFHPEDGRSTIL
jgi:hypothetical protein